MAITQINKQVKGSVSLGDLTPDFFRTFPNISVRLSDVTIRDSLWDQHHHDFLKAEKIYIRFQLLSLLTGKPKIGKVIVEDGSVYLYTDECGYCNLDRTDDLSFNKGHADIPEITFVNTRLIIENESLNTYHDIDVDYLNCDIVKKDSAVLLTIAMNSLVHSVGFNMEKGSYLKEKHLEGEFCLSYYSGKKIELNNVKLKIDKHPFTLNGNFYLDTDPMSYDLSIQTRKIHYQKAVSILTQSLQLNFDSIDIIQPFDVNATVAGQMARKVVPRVFVQFTVNDTDMETPLGQFYLCSYTGNFSNQVDSLLLPGDENSKFIFNNFHGKWSNIPITSSRIEISNLKDPFMICDLQSVFALEDLNALAESSTIRFLKGMGNLDVMYNGPLVNKDTIHPLLNGTFSLTDAEINYMPRNLLFKNCNGDLEFRNEDLIINQLLASAGNTNLTMSGNVINLLALLNINPEQLTMEWNISTPDLNLNDFVSYVGQRAEVSIKKAARKNKLIKAAENIDRMLRDGTAKLNVKARKMTYKKFMATNVAASMLLAENKILLNDVKLIHAGGLVLLKGSLTNENHSNLINLEARIENVDIPDIFHAFDNFGQDAITEKNMKGRLSAKIKMTGALTDKATVMENSMKGTVDFIVKNGELINFEPAVKIAATAFKKRDFSQIRFAELNNRLEIDGSAIKINKMEIRSNVVILFVEGVYDTKKGTDMSIQVPVSNLSKTKNEIVENTGRAGVNIRLRAKTGDDGKLKVSWDLFNNATKKRNVENKMDSIPVSRGNKQ